MKGWCNRNILYYLAALIWGVPGIILSIKGIRAYCRMPADELWWLLLITVAVLAGFFFMFRSIVDKYSKRIAGLPEKTTLIKTFPPRGWIMILFFMTLGIVLKLFPGIPEEFTASFYCGLGPMLVWAAGRFILKSVEE